MKSIVSYENRGIGGNNQYRGNCSPLLIEDLYNHFKFDNISDYMRGSNTTGDVAKKLGISAQTYDLNMGFDLLNDEIPERNDFIFWHPPYWDIIQYSGNMYGVPLESDLSRITDYNKFINQIDYCMAKQYASLVKGGRMAILVGDVKKNRKLYSMFLDMAKMGTIEQIVIKQQHNCWSDNRSYNGKFIPIVHEYLLITRKDSNYMIDIKRTKDFEIDIRDSLKVTWKEVVAAALEQLGKKADLASIYKEIEGHRKAQNNPHWKEKIRQVLQMYTNLFKPLERGIWSLI